MTTIRLVDIADESSIVDDLPIGYVNILSSETGLKFPPIFCNDRYQIEAVFIHDYTGVTKMRTYRKWYRKDVLVTGLDREGNRVRIRMDREGRLV